MDRYEPIILKKKQARTISGTPYAKFRAFVNLTIISVPIVATYFYSQFIGNKKQIIAELDEYNFNTRKLNKWEEYMISRDVWNSPYLKGITNYVLQKYEERGELAAVNESSITPAEVLECQKDLPKFRIL